MAFPPHECSCYVAIVAGRAPAGSGRNLREWHAAVLNATLKTAAFVSEDREPDRRPEWVFSGRRHGLRHQTLTAVSSQSWLALLANNVADALDSLRGENHLHTIIAHGGLTTTCLPGYALSALDAGGLTDGSLPATFESLPWTAKLAMREAAQPRMEEPTTFPLLMDRDLDSKQAIEPPNLATLHALYAPMWRISPASTQHDPGGAWGSTSSR